MIMYIVQGPDGSVAFTAHKRAVEEVQAEFPDLQVEEWDTENPDREWAAIVPIGDA